MKLKNKNESPVGGWWIRTDDNMLIEADEGGLDMLISRTREYLTRAKLPIPPDLSHWVQDQICQRQPADRCKYTKGLGDIISQGIHVAAASVDSVLGTNFQSRARSCRKCGGRRRVLNSASSR